MKIHEMIRESRMGAGLTQAELAGRAGTSQPAVNRYERGAELPSLPTLERLIRATGRSLVIDTAPPRSGLLSARSGDRPLARLLREARPRVLALIEEHGGRNPRVFGSVARGTERRGSDIDLLVELAPGRTLLDLVGIRDALRDELDVGVDVATPDMLKPAARAAALREAIPL